MIKQIGRPLRGRPILFISLLSTDRIKYNITKVKCALWLVSYPSTICLLVHAKKLSFRSKIEEIQQISSPVNKMHRWNEIKSGSWIKYTQLSFWRKKSKGQTTNLRWMNCFLRGYDLRRKTERAKLFEDLSPRFKVHFVCFYRRESLFWNGDLSISIVSLTF